MASSSSIFSSINKFSMLSMTIAVFLLFVVHEHHIHTVDGQVISTDPCLMLEGCTRVQASCLRTCYDVSSSTELTECTTPCNDRFTRCFSRCNQTTIDPCRGSCLQEGSNCRRDLCGRLNAEREPGNVAGCLDFCTREINTCASRCPIV